MDSLNRSRQCAIIKLTLVVVTIILLSSGCATLGRPGGDPQSFMKIRWPGAAKLGPDGNLYYVYHPDGVTQLYKVPPNGKQADAVRLTHFEDGIDSYSMSDDGKWIAVTAGLGGSEQFDLYLLNTATGDMESLFVDPGVVYGGVTWRRDSKAFAFFANDKSPRDFHIYMFDLDTRQHRRLMADEGLQAPADFSRNGDRLVVFKYNSASYTQLFELDLESGNRREITPKDQQWYFSPVGYSADETTFLVTSNYNADLNSVREIDLRTCDIRAVLPELESCEVDYAVFNDERTVLATVTNEGGYGTLRLYGTADYARMPSPPMDRGVVSNLAFTGSQLLYALNNTNTPGVVYKWDYTEPDKPGAAVTEAETFGIDVSRFLLPELIHYESFDGERIPAFLYLPPEYKKGERIPFIIRYHGGPEGQSRPVFSRSYQYFLSIGFGILLPNVRGSSGYGKAYLQADNYRNRHKSVKDGIWAAKYLIHNGYSSPEMIGAWGASYGGFMVMAMLTEAPELFGAGCNVVGIVNFETFLEQTAEYRRHLREAEYGPLDDREFLRSISPIYKVDRIRAPLMIAHGMNDPRVPIGEATQIASALKKRGLPVKELYFPDEGHGFAKEENRLIYYMKMMAFFEKHLGR